MKRMIPPLVAVMLVCLMGISINAQGDITPPVLVDMIIEPAHVDTSAGPQTITITAHITDDLSGVSYAWVVFGREGTTQSFGAHFLIEGAVDATQTVTATLPQYAAEGWWTIRQLTLEDMTKVIPE